MKRFHKQTTRSASKKKKNEEDEHSKKILEQIVQERTTKTPVNDPADSDSDMTPTSALKGEFLQNKPHEIVNTSHDITSTDYSQAGTSQSMYSHLMPRYPFEGRSYDISHVTFDRNQNMNPINNIPYAPFRSEMPVSDFRRNTTFDNEMPSHIHQLNHATPLNEILARSISKDGVLDLYRAGAAVHASYSRCEAGTVNECESFARRHSYSVKTFSLPPVHRFSDPNYFSIIQHGQLILSLLKSHSIQQPVAVQKEGEMEYKSLVGAIYRTRSLNLQYPAEAPFSGGSMFLVDRPVSKGRRIEESHVVLKRLIFQLLERSCSVPTDIQTTSWNLPYENSYSTHSFFPEKLYIDMRTFFLNYFGIEEVELENGLWSDNFANLKCLASWETVAVKKKRFGALSSARAAFMSKDGFHSCLREALKEIKRARYDPPSSGSSFGTWTFRKRNKTRDLPHSSLQ